MFVSVSFSMYVLHLAIAAGAGSLATLYLKRKK
jgi:hypothetical protein